jgi:hypothetical protein
VLGVAAGWLTWQESQLTPAERARERTGAAVAAS